MLIKAFFDCSLAAVQLFRKCIVAISCLTNANIFGSNVFQTLQQRVNHDQILIGMNVMTTDHLPPVLGDLGVQQLPKAAGDPDQAGRLVLWSGWETWEPRLSRQRAVRVPNAW